MNFYLTTMIDDVVGVGWAFMTISALFPFFFLYLSLSDEKRIIIIFFLFECYEGAKENDWFGAKLRQSSLRPF